MRRLAEFGAYVEEQDLPAFANVPRNLRIELPRRICEARHIHIGDDVNIGPSSLLIAQSSYPSDMMRSPDGHQRVQQFAPKIVIGHRVTATGTLTLSAVNSVVIEDDVMIAANVFIADHTHGYDDANRPYKFQPLSHIAPVVIKRGCWLGQNAVIMPGVTIGELAIVGANSVVTKDVPPRSIVVGAPARRVKRWDEEGQQWVPVPLQRDAPEPTRTLSHDIACARPVAASDKVGAGS